MLYNKHLSAFLRVYELGSFSKAAKSLFISVPSLIQQIDILESELNVKLFIRTNHGVHATKEGEYLAKKAPDIITLANEIESNVKMIKSQFIVATGRLIEPIYFKEFWQQNKNQYPNINLKFIESNTITKGLKNTDINTDLIENLYYPDFEKKLGTFYSLFQTEMKIAVPKNSYWAKQKRLTYSDLSNTTLISIKPNLSEAADKLRNDILQNSKKVSITYSDLYSSSFIDNSIENNYLIILPDCWKEICKPYILKSGPKKFFTPYGVYIKDKYKKIAQDMQKFFGFESI